MNGRTELVGRQRELEVIERGCRRRDGRLVIVSGDAGIGKSRLVEEATRAAWGWSVLPVSCACLPMSEKLPLLPVCEALRQLSRRDGGQQLAAALDRAPGFVRAELARLVPGLTGGDAAEGRRADAAGKERLFGAVAELLLHLAQPGPDDDRAAVLLVVEDVQWADSATLDLLTYLHAAAMSTGRLQIVVTCRTDERPQAAHVIEWLAHLRRLPAVTELRLGPLDAAEVERHLAGLLDRAPSPQLVETLYTRAQGNPFFTEQLLAAVDETGEHGALPGRVAELLAVRLTAVGADARSVLAALSVAGRPLPEDAVQAATGLDESGTGRALHELADAALLAPPTPGGAHAVRHALLAEAVRSSLLPGERRIVHARLAHALESTGDSTLAAETAAHWAGAGRPERELPARVRAAEAAAHVAAFAAAADAWLRAIALGEQHPEVLTGLGLGPAELHVEAVDALEAAGRLREAARLAERTCVRFGRGTDSYTAARIHWRAGYFGSVHRPDQADALLATALGLFGAGPPTREQARALLSRAVLLRLQGRTGESLAAASTSLDVLRRATVGDGPDPHPKPDVDLWAGAVQVNALLVAGRTDDAWSVAVDGLRLSRESGRVDSFLAGIHLAQAVEAAITGGRRERQAELAPWIADFQPVAGLWPVYLTLAGRLLLVDRTARAGARGQGGAPPAAEREAVDPLAARQRLSQAVQRLRALSTAGRKDAPDPVLRADPAVDVPEDSGPPDAGAWAEAAEVWQQLTRPQRMAYAEWRHAEGLLSRGDRVGQGDRATAQLLLQHAARNAAGHDRLLSGITGLAARARLPLADTGPQPERPVEQKPFDLTARERSVLHLLTLGRTNAQIGAELYMSPKTASVHVTNIIRKLGVANRVEAAAVAERVRLFGEGSEPAGGEAAVRGSGVGAARPGRR